jgi:DNA-binding transcriptional regulator YiaG
VGRCAGCIARAHTSLVRVQHFRGGVELRGELPADACSCGASTIQLETLARFEVSAAAALAIAGVCTGESFRFIRKSLGMRASDVGKILGVTPETVSRWETGQRDVDPHVFAMLGEIAIATAEGRPSPAERFKALASTKRKKPGTIDVKLAS